MATEHETQKWAGVLKLGVTDRGGRSVATSQYHEGALRVLRPHYLDGSSQVTYTAVNPGGAYFGADRYLLDIAVDDGASLLLTTQSATKVYKTPQGPASQKMKVELGPGAVFDYLPDQLIVYREGAYRQSTTVTMDPTASLTMSEIITPGWAPDGAPFKYRQLRMRTEIRVATEQGSKLLAVDQLRLNPDELGDVQGVGLLEGFSHTGQLLLADARIDDALYARLAELVDESATRSGITRAGLETLGVRCVVVRSLAHSTEEIAALHRSIVNLTRRLWRGQPDLDLRKH